MAASEPLLALRDIHTYYGDSYVLHGVSLNADAGRIATEGDVSGVQLASAAFGSA